jgi:hypothetical protein
MLTPADIAPEVLRILEQARRGKGEHPHFLTAYQILDRLSVREQLAAERGAGGGAGADVYYSAASVVKDAIKHLRNEVQTEFLDNVGAFFNVASEVVRAGNEVCAIYRVRRPNQG